MQTPGSASDPGALRDDCSSAPLDVVAANVPSRSAAPRTRPKAQLVRTRLSRPVPPPLSLSEINEGCFCAASVSAQQQRFGQGAVVASADTWPRERRPMRWSRAFLPVLKESPSVAQIVSHKLMLRAGLVRQTAAGIYAWLPLGFRVLKKIEQIVREEQDRAGALEMLMPTLQSADLWRASGRYDAYGPAMLRVRDRHDRERLYGPPHEEMMPGLL